MFLFCYQQTRNMKNIIVCAILWIFIGLMRAESSGLQQYLQETRSSDPVTIVQNVDDLQIFLKEFNIEAAEMCNRVAINEWKYALNASDYNKRRVKEFESVAKKFDCLSWRRAAAYSSFRLADTNIKRQLDRIVRQGRCGLNENKFQELMQIIVQMKDNYRSAKICPYPGNGPTVPMQVNDRMDSVSEMDSISGNYVTTYTGYCDLTIDNDLQRLMEISRSEPELRHAFSAFREKVGPPNRNNFMRYVDLVNQAAHIHGFRDAGEQMRAVYDDPDMFFTVQDLWTKIQPLYRQLFTFVRKGLVRYYGESVVRKDGPIPAHLLGNMWAQNWKNILDIVKYRHSETPDVTGEMIKQGYTPLRIFQQAEEFFTSLGLPAMSPEFWRNSILQGTNEANGKCAASAWDFCNNIDFRVKQCTQISIEDFINTHQELAHIQYYMHYTNQPFVYRDGPNPAFHNSIAHAIGLCAGGPVHLQRIGLLSSPVQTSNGHSVINIEYLLAMALDKLPSLAFSLSIEKWRWEMFEKGPIGMNSRWWELRLRYQGIIPPVPRSSDDFDPGAEYHIISDQDHIKYFYSTILQFQIYSELCQGINHVGPLHTCDFYRSREAGRILSDVMSQGASLPTSQILKVLSRGKTSQLSADAILEFFRPLSAWLEQQNRDEYIGWNSNIDDVLMFKPLTSATSKKLHQTLYLEFSLVSLIGFCSFYFYY